MYLNILKKDLKRRRAMNVILLVFIILASMFVSSGVNNIVSVVAALDNYFDMAGVPDYAAGITNKSSDKDVRGTIENASAIDELRTEEMVFMSQSNIIRDGEPLNASAGNQILQSDRDLAMNYFLDDESILESVPRGKVYATHFAEKNTVLKPGDKITIEIEGISREFTFAGSIKDAVLGSQMNGITRFIINAEDFDEFMSNETVKNMYGGQLFYIFAADLDKALSQIADISDCFIFSGDRQMLKFSYIFNIMVTGIILVVSLILIIISFVVLRFTIIFTLSEEFREIGVMKAIGIRDIKIRGLYLVKYAALSVVGAAVGLALSYPFGKMLMSLSTDAIIISNDNISFINVICAVFVAAVILLFCLGCTGRVGKMTPIDAVRNGQTGERFRKKSLMSLGKSRLGATAFLAVNDIVSSPKRYSIIAFTFFLCMSLLIIFSNAVASLESAKLLKYFGLADCHVLADNDTVPFMTEGGREKLEKYLEDMERSLAENGMPAECMQEFMFSPVIKHGEYESKVLTFQGTGTEMDMYEYAEGTAPQNSGEIALTTLAAKALKANIGDSVVMSDGAGEREYIVTALYQSMNNQGVAARLYTGEDMNYLLSIGSSPVQIKFTDDPDDGETARRAEKIAELYPKFSNVKTAGEWVRETTGVADAINTAKEMFVLLTVILTALIAVLTERSFIEKERSEIALMKAIGLRNSKIYAHHTVRFLIVTAAAVIAAELLGMPLTKLCIDPVFRMMGLEMGVEYQQTPAEIYALFPAAVFAAAVAGAFFTSLYTRKIKSSDTANIE
ncbi:MAG: ABC transporter permease [Lachnospiraceae bacterium]|nr:ABC transporter permease [Ruminococcus sp.]MCM1276720.1 ABC transporter permease [Lachnospiraceae bacterium]